MRTSQDIRSNVPPSLSNFSACGLHRGLLDEPGKGITTANGAVRFEFDRDGFYDNRKGLVVIKWLLQAVSAKFSHAANFFDKFVCCICRVGARYEASYKEDRMI